MPGSIYTFTDAGDAYKRLSWTFEKEGTKLEWRWKCRPAPNSKEITAGLLDFLMDEIIKLSVALVVELISKIRPAQERDSIAYTFHGGVPTTVTYKASNRLMFQNLLLRCPTDYKTIGTHSVLKSCWVGIRTHHPEERSIAEFKPHCQFLELGLVKTSCTAKCNIHD